MVADGWGAVHGCGEIEEKYPSREKSIYKQNVLGYSRVALAKKDRARHVPSR